jgi:gamma-glutamylcyclotransferase (GGCT)/AIG2-like uncharacterized protein YtfP
MHLVFVYGTLKKGQGNHERCCLDKASFVGNGKISGRIYSLGAFPGLKPDNDSKVYGEVYKVDDTTLARLDRLEGHPRMYERKEIIVETNTNEFCEAWAYFYNGNVDNRHYIRSGIW